MAHIQLPFHRGVLRHWLHSHPFAHERDLISPQGSKEFSTGNISVKQRDGAIIKQIYWTASHQDMLWDLFFL